MQSKPTTKEYEIPYDQIDPIEYPALNTKAKFEIISKPVFFVPGLSKGDVAFFESVYRKEPYSGACKENMVLYVKTNNFDDASIDNYILYITNMFMDSLYTNSNIVLNNGVYGALCKQYDDGYQQNCEYLFERYKENCPFDKFKEDGRSIAYAMFTKFKMIYEDVDRIKQDQYLFRSIISEVLALCTKFATGWIYSFVNDILVSGTPHIRNFSDCMTNAFIMANNDIARISEIAEVSYISSFSELLELKANELRYRQSREIVDMQNNL